MQLSFAEMMGCAEEALEASNVRGSVDVVGHSHSAGVCAAWYWLVVRPAALRT